MEPQEPAKPAPARRVRPSRAKKPAVVAGAEASASVAAAQPEVIYAGAAAETPSSARHAAAAEDGENVILRLSVGGEPCAQPPAPDPYEEYVGGAPLGPMSPTRAPPEAPLLGGPRVVRLLTEFEEKSKVGEWPSSTSVHCYWCCHRFDNTPYGLPVRFASDQFQVIGCFCSLECACAYNFASRESVDECMNRYAMLNALAARLGAVERVRPAPDRLALAMFGGHLSITAFRALFATPRQVVVNPPPMLAMPQQVEEVHETDLRSEYRYIPIDAERVSRYQEKVRLKRTKPLVNFKNTLDHAMNVRFVSPPRT